MSAKVLKIALVDDHLPNTHEIVAKVLDGPGCRVFAIRPSQSVPDLPTPFYIQGAVRGMSAEIVPYSQFHVIDREQ